MWKRDRTCTKVRPISQPDDCGKVALWKEKCSPAQAEAEQALIADYAGTAWLGGGRAAVSLEGQHHVTPLYLRVPATAPHPKPVVFCWNHDSHPKAAWAR